MDAVKPREEMTRQEIVSFALRQCALLCDPKHGHLKSLAAVIDAHEVTLSVWIGQGYVPEHQVRKLQKKFGKKNAPLDDLCPVEFRRS
jgi:hypothetical protein